jgi:hypothetical protein|tara:strand:- start:496 stop:693 length:198 start_codon:yes stop_codon:yes gene_type:complete
MINLNKVNLNTLSNEQLDTYIYYIQNELTHDRHTMLASTINKRMDDILKMRRILNEREGVSDEEI